MTEVFGSWLKRVVVFATIPVVLLFAVELACRILKVPKISHNNIDAKAAQLLPEIDASTVLIVGDSRLEWGIRPDEIEKELKNKKLKVLNLAMPGSNGLDVLEYVKQNGIEPAAVIIGNTVFYGQYSNHDLHNLNCSVYQQLKTSFYYFVQQHLYVADQSIPMYLHHEQVYFKSHAYDSKGGAVVEEYGNYASRYFYQEKMYNRWHDQFNNRDYCRYNDSLNSHIKYFAQNEVPLLVLRMPVSQKIQNFEPEFVNCDTRIDSAYILDYRNWRSLNTDADSLQFYDGSHLTVESSVNFSKILASALNDKLN